MDHSPISDPQSSGVHTPPPEPEAAVPEAESPDSTVPSGELSAATAHQSGARWFYWIAGLSVINTIALHAGSDRTFIIGLGITQVLDVIARDIGGFAPVIAIVLDVLFTGLFVLFGYFGVKGRPWAFLVGMVLYALDGIIYVLAQEWLSVGFHIFALFGIFSGWKALRAYHDRALRPVSSRAAVLPREAEPMD